jgi:hypothetical protein
MPETIAESPSTLRELAYLEDIPIALPVLDSGGWKLLPPVEAAGTLIPNAIVTARLSIANPVRPCFSHLTVVNVHFIWDSCHLHWVHRYRYSSSYLMTRLQTLTSTQLMSVSFAPSLLVVSPVACASSTLHAQRSGQRQAPLLTGLNYWAKLSLAGDSRQALFSQSARCRYMHFLSASLCQWI